MGTAPTVRNQMEKNMEHDMETWIHTVLVFRI